MLLTDAKGLTAMETQNTSTRSDARFLCTLITGCLLLVSSVQADNRKEVIFFLNDALGSAVAAVNESGELCWSEDYTPYGDKTVNDDVFSPPSSGCGIVGEERGFTGHTEDVNSDLVYMQQRYYDPSIGRFLSIDPLDANPNDPKAYNRYAYANNNPYKYIDPDGRQAVSPFMVPGYMAQYPATNNGAQYQKEMFQGLTTSGSNALTVISVVTTPIAPISRIAGAGATGLGVLGDTLEDEPYADIARDLIVDAGAGKLGDKFSDIAKKDGLENYMPSSMIDTLANAWSSLLSYGAGGVTQPRGAGSSSNGNSGSGYDNYGNQIGGAQRTYVDANFECRP